MTPNLLSAFIALTALSSNAGAAECPVDSLFDIPSIAAPPEGDPSRTRRQTQEPVSLSMGISSGYDPSKEAPEEKLAREIRDTIRRGDLAGFTALMPTDPVKRRALLRKGHFIRSAFREGSLPLVRQMLHWDPMALAETYPGANSSSLWEVARSWAGRQFRLRQDPSVPVGSEQDHLELIRLLLDAGADPNGPKVAAERSPLVIVAGLPPSPQSTEASLLLTTRGAATQVPKTNDSSPLLAAAGAGNGAVVRKILSTGTFSQDALDEAMVRVPMTGPSMDAIEAMLEAGANINADGSRWGRTFYFPAFHASLWAKSHDDEKLLWLLIGHKVDPNLTYKHKPGSALMNVIHRPDLVKALIGLGADVNFRTGELGDSPLLLATRRPQGSRLDPGLRGRSVALLLEAGADPNSMKRDGVTALMQLGPDDAPSIELLLARGTRINLEHDSFSFHRKAGLPLGQVSWAILQKNATLATAILRRETRIDPLDCGAVYYAAAVGMQQVLTALLDRKADAKLATEVRGMTPLITAAERGHLQSVRVLLDRKAASVDEASAVYTVTDPFGTVLTHGRFTALMTASAAGHIEVVRDLIARGASVDQRDYEHRSALDYTSQQDIKALLLANGARR